LLSTEDPLHARSSSGTRSGVALAATRLAISIISDSLDEATWVGDERPASVRKTVEPVAIAFRTSRCAAVNRANRLARSALSTTDSRFELANTPTPASVATRINTPRDTMSATASLISRALAPAMSMVLMSFGPPLVARAKTQGLKRQGGTYRVSFVFEPLLEADADRLGFAIFDTALSQLG